MISGLTRPAPIVTPVGAKLLSAGLLIGAFIGVVLWFDEVDFYHRHFFEPGALVVVDNLVRVVFVCIFSWLIYAPGAGVAALVMSARAQSALTPAERAVLGFGIGIGIWHVAMLILGELNLYYRPVMAGLCLVIVVASSGHFGAVAVAGCSALAERVKALRRRRASPQEVAAILVVASAVWLLLRRGLYPGGGTDYYTHYFYYYLEVLKNHGLAPNVVWYHYYYSKGSGLTFLAMLLSDSEGVALATYSCVLCAAGAIATLFARMAPGSLWPAAGVLAYLFFYLIGVVPYQGEGEFQKDHEEIAALVVLFLWALCMECCGPALPFRLMAAATAIAAAVVTQAVGMLLGLFVGLLFVWSALRRRWCDVWGFGVLGAAIAGAVLGMFVLSYLQTGLPSDQPMRPMLHFADFTRLDRWDVIPEVILGVWNRDNYVAILPHIGWGTLKELRGFLRLGALWPFFYGPLIVALMMHVADRFTVNRLTLFPDAAAASLAVTSAARLGAFLGLFTFIALVFGRDQTISFTRLTTFIVPSIVMFGIAGCVWVLTSWFGGRRDRWAWMVLPAAMLATVVIEWQVNDHWSRRAPAEAANALRFFFGELSLAQAYERVAGAYDFGAINPAALAAARQLPYGTPIWSTSTEAYCMVPGCYIESAQSFMIPKLDEILGDDPELAKRQLQKAGLNYFMFMKDYRIIDLLPFARLFAPDTIGRYLGVKWSDGSTYLLTWIGPDTRPIGPDFLEAYTRRRDTPDATRWFRFGELAPFIVALSPRLREAKHWGPDVEKLFTWHCAEPSPRAQCQR